MIEFSTHEPMNLLPAPSADRALPAARSQPEVESLPDPVAQAIAPPEPRPVVCLAHDRWQLLAEEIDRNPERQTSWVRPLILADYGSAAARHQGDRPQMIYASNEDANNEESVDLVLPSNRLRLALDVELAALLAERPSPQSVAPDSAGRAIFQAFVRSLF